jgi:hypothetical protein
MEAKPARTLRAKILYESPVYGATPLSGSAVPSAKTHCSELLAAAVHVVRADAESDDQYPHAALRLCGNPLKRISRPAARRSVQREPNFCINNQL